jgi:hypothetical protein
LKEPSAVTLSAVLSWAGEILWAFLFGEMKTTVLLPDRLYEGFKDFFEALGFKVVWENEIDDYLEPIDVAVEWQYESDDYTILDLIKKHGKDARVFLALNYNGKAPANLKALGYAGFLRVPFKFIEVMTKFTIPIG